MTQQIVAPNGDVEVALTATQSIAVRTSGPGSPAKIYRQAGFPNYPNTFVLLGQISDQEQSYGPFTGGGVVRIEAGPNAVLYNVDVAPLGATTFLPPIGNPSFFGYDSDFLTYVAAEWTVTHTGAGSVANTDAIGGQVLLTNAGADNNNSFLQLGGSQNGESFAFQAGKPLWFDTRFKVDNILADTFAGLYVTDTDPEGGVAAGVYFRRLTTATALDLIVENSSTETVVTTGIVMANDTFVNVGIYWDGASLYYTQNRRILGQVTTLANLPSTELRLSFGVQNGTAAARTMTVDWVSAYQQR
jgi:hypothetical protein